MLNELLLIAVLSVGSFTQASCPKYYYRNESTENCQHCSSLCNIASQLEVTNAACKRLCASYIADDACVPYRKAQLNGKKAQICALKDVKVLNGIVKSNPNVGWTTICDRGYGIDTLANGEYELFEACTKFCGAHFNASQKPTAKCVPSVEKPASCTESGETRCEYTGSHGYQYCKEIGCYTWPQKTDPQMAKKHCQLRCPKFAEECAIPIEGALKADQQRSTPPDYISHDGGNTGTRTDQALPPNCQEIRDCLGPRLCINPERENAAGMALEIKISLIGASVFAGVGLVILGVQQKRRRRRFSLPNDPNHEDSLTQAVSDGGEASAQLETLVSQQNDLHQGGAAVREQDLDNSSNFEGNQVDSGIERPNQPA